MHEGRLTREPGVTVDTTARRQAGQTLQLYCLAPVSSPRAGARVGSSQGQKSQTHGAGGSATCSCACPAGGPSASRGTGDSRPRASWRVCSFPDAGSLLRGLPNPARCATVCQGDRALSQGSVVHGRGHLEVTPHPSYCVPSHDACDGAESIRLLPLRCQPCRHVDGHTRRVHLEVCRLGNEPHAVGTQPCSRYTPVFPLYA